MTNATLQAAWNIAMARLEAEGGAMDNLSEPLQTVLMVEAAQGIIDNGGLENFYESDFPDNPPYAVFVDAYRRVGAEFGAHCIESTARMFPFAEPHMHAEKRQAWLERVGDDEQHEFVRLSRRLCGDESVFAKLADYVERNQHAFTAV